MQTIRLRIVQMESLAQTQTVVVRKGRLSLTGRHLQHQIRGENPCWEGTDLLGRNESKMKEMNESVEPHQTTINIGAAVDAVLGVEGW